MILYVDFVNFFKHKAYIYCVNCVKQNRTKVKWSAKRKFRVAIFVFLAIIGVFIFYYYKVVCPIIASLSEERVRSIATSAISEVVGDTLLEEGVSYSDLAIVKYSDSNTVDLIEINTIEMNILVRKITKGVQDKFNNINNEKIEISLGTFTGIPFLYGIGSNVSINLVPIGTVNTKINSRFISAGINQTLHQLYFVVNAGIGMILPAKTQNFNTELEVMLCESVIVGKVPEIYFHGNLI